MYYQLGLAVGMLLVRVSAQCSKHPVKCSAEGVFFDAKGDCCQPSNVRKQLIEGLANEEYDLLCAESLTIPGLPEATPEDIDALGKCRSFSFDELNSACSLLNKTATTPFTKEEESFLRSPNGKGLLSAGFRKEDVKKLPKNKFGRPTIFGVDLKKEFGIDPELLNKTATTPFTKEEESFFQSPHGKGLLSAGFRKEDVKKLPKNKFGRPTISGVDLKKEFGIEF